MEDGAQGHRPVLEEYTVKLLDELISVVTPVTLISYLLYTLDPSNRAHFGSQMPYLASVFVALASSVTSTSSTGTSEVVLLLGS